MSSGLKWEGGQRGPEAQGPVGWAGGSRKPGKCLSGTVIWSDSCPTKLLHGEGEKAAGGPEG